MFKKIISIKNIGKFKKHESSEMTLRSIVGIYSENGKGKTTLTSILRSLSKNNPKIILGRRRLNESGRPYFKAETDSGFLEFNNDVWSTPLNNIEIFDSHFINENLYSGMQVDLAQKRNLYKFIIGDEAIKLNDEVVGLNDQINALTSRIREQRVAVTKLAGNELEVNAFIELENVEDIDSKIEAKDKEVTALTKKESLSKKEILEVISLPKYDFDFLETILNKTLEGVSKEAEDSTKQHIQGCLNEGGEQWLKTGIEYLGPSNNCPFCNKDTSDSALVTSYKSYFNEAYVQFKEQLVIEETRFSKNFSESAFNQIINTLKNNSTLASSWAEYTQLPSIEIIPSSEEGGIHKNVIDKSQTEEAGQVSGEIAKLVSKKCLTPLDVIPSITEDYGRLFAKWRKFVDAVSTYNGLIGNANAVITQFKKGLSSSDLSIEKKGLATLKATKKRFEEDSIKACDIFKTLEAEKKTLETQKENAKTQLDAATQKIPQLYQDKINSYLGKFGADFRIYDHRKINPRGEPATEYKILINGAEVPVGDGDSPEEIASFKNTLSEGDKNTLAFSYFLAKLDRDPSLSQKIIVFDDPISSLDSSRRLWTKSYLKFFGCKAKQLIVLSHDSKFLEEVFSELKKVQKEMMCLKITLGDGGSILEKSNFADLSKSIRTRNLETLKAYVSKKIGQPFDVIKTLRPLCEDFVKDQCPNDIEPSDNLGLMIRKIREAPDGSDLASLKTMLLDFDTLNSYSTGEHHGQGENSNSENETQFHTQCVLTLKLINEYETCAI